MANWSIHIQAAVNDEPAEEVADQLMDTLTGYNPVVSGRRHPSALAATLDVEAVNLRTAIATGVRAFTDALRSAGVRGAVVDLVDAKSYEQLDRELAKPTIPELVGAAEIAAMVSDPPITRQRVHQLMDRDDFPPPVAELAAGKVFVRSQVEAFLRSWPRKRTGRPRKVPLVGVA